MTKKTWDLYAPIYKRAMRADQKIYDFMYQRIPEIVKGKEVLEIATGPGLLAKHIAPATKSTLATDYSNGMIAEAKKVACPDNLHFEVADAMALPYRDTHLVHVYHILHTFTFCKNLKNQHKTQKSGSAERFADPDFLCNRVRDAAKPVVSRAFKQGRGSKNKNADCIKISVLRRKYHILIEFARLIKILSGSVNCCLLSGLFASYAIKLMI